MKILIVNKFLFPNGGSETYIFELGKKLSKMGHQVQYFGMEHEGCIVGNDAESYTSDMDFHGNGLSKLLYPFRILYSFEARKKIRVVLKDFEPDVVHLNNINFQITPSVIDEIRAYKKKRIKIVFTAHDYQWVCPNHMMMIPSNKEMCFRCEGGCYSECVKNKCIHDSKVKSILGAVEAFLHNKLLKTYAKVDKIICPSYFMENKLKTNPLLKDKLVTIHNFLDTNVNTDYEKQDYVLYFGRYSEEKGVKTLLDVCKELSDIPFVFAGGGPLEKEVALVPNIENKGFLRGEELTKLIAQAKFCIFPSEWYENCPFTVMESQLYGTPILAADVGGVSELLQDGVTGQLFQCGNKRELKEQLVTLWNNSDILQCYTENCKKIKFITSEEYCKKIIDVYKYTKRE